jgi:hypothetical protein
VSASVYIKEHDMDENVASVLEKRKAYKILGRKNLKNISTWKTQMYICEDTIKMNPKETGWMSVE